MSYGPYLSDMPEKEAKDSLNELLARMRSLESDHKPDGWPAVQMKDITALLNEIEKLRS